MKNISVTIILIFYAFTNLNAQNEITFDLKAVPFSYYGSYMVINSRINNNNNANKTPEFFFSDVSGTGRSREEAKFKIETLQNGKLITCSAIATPSKVTLTNGSATCEICYEDCNTLRFRAIGMDLRLVCDRSYRYCFPTKKGQWLIPSYVFTSIKGEAENKVDAGKKTTFTFYSDGSKSAEFAIENFTGGHKNRDFKPFDDCVKGAVQVINKWISQYPPCDKKYRNTLDLALYINWSSVVEPRENMTQYGMFMSKNQMCNVWSWDNCFNAIGTAYGQPDLAWAQIQVMFDHQYKAGNFPDCLNDYASIKAFVKPPVYGLIIKNLIEKNKINKNQLPDIYNRISALTNFWLEYRDLNGNGIPEYFHGNDSGWDNSSVFNVGFANESADLCTFLICQMDFLAEIAPQAGKPSEAKYWIIKSDKMLKLMLANLWEDNHFVSKNNTTGLWNKESKALLQYIPLILGERLPKEYRVKIISDLKKSGNFTQHGVASEDPVSPFYKPDGYWLGPIWAPSSWLIIKGLDKCGEKALAKELAEKYCDMCIKSGFPENFNALTGEPLRDLAYTWTSSVFIDLLYEYVSPVKK